MNSNNEDDDLDLQAAIALSLSSTPSLEPSPPSPSSPSFTPFVFPESLLSLGQHQPIGEVKVVMLVRTDLKMGVGKMCAQCAHSSLGIFREMKESHTYFRDIMNAWEFGGQAKIALRCPSEDEMMVYESKAKQLGLPTYTVHDAGRTQIAAGSATVCAIAGPKHIVDTITGHLKLL